LALVKANTLKAHAARVRQRWGNTNSGNYYAQALSLKNLAKPYPPTWYMLSAVQAHENVHVSRFQPAMNIVESFIILAVERLSIPNTGQTREEAIATIKASPAFQDYQNGSGFQAWLNEWSQLGVGDDAPGGPTSVIEHSIVDPMIRTICDAAATNGWTGCICPL
jgi:hypothetical protein